MTDSYQARIEKTEARMGRDAAIQRGTSIICGAFLGREFGEPADAYLLRKPELQSFITWFTQYRSAASPSRE